MKLWEQYGDGKIHGNRVGREEIHGDGVRMGTIYFTVSLSTVESCCTTGKALLAALVLSCRYEL